MNFSGRKYKSTFTFILLSAYLLGIFNMPLFEGFHFLLHLGDSTPLHSFQSHENQHQHKVLLTLEDLVENDSSSEIPPNKSKTSKIHKLVQVIISSDSKVDLSTTRLNTNFYSIPKFYQSNYLLVNTPPPRT